MVSTFLNSQGWVTLALVVRVRLCSALTIPIRFWLVESSCCRVLPTSLPWKSSSQGRSEATPRKIQGGREGRMSKV
ncbi:hypothetical protein [Ferrovum myxofaciens]|uniref:hypothetical protein n=1 Tax=Ferrovum myxofaciens TaxID=416213 RepID=UPI002352C67D|nr:hypothetical protein [Ferrovum myxofaciens]